jgi:hypothetical protein
MAKRQKRVESVRFGDVPVGERFSFPKDGTRGRRAIYTKASGRSYSTRLGDKIQQRAQSAIVEIVR